MKNQVKSLARTVWEVLKFEAVCKLFAILLVCPLLNGVFRIYATSEGLHFNGDIVSAFLSPAGAAVLLFVLAGAAAFVYWELSIVIRIAALTRQGTPFRWRELWWGSLWGLGALRGVSFPASAVFYLGILPLAAVGYVNTLLPTLALPGFIYSELRRYGAPGVAAMLAIPALYYLPAALCLFAPLYMALERRGFFDAARCSLRAWRRLGWRVLAVAGACLAWVGVATRIAQYWRRNRLELTDFDTALLRNLLYSQAFRIDFVYWLLRAVLDAAAMALFIRLLLACADPGRTLRAVADPAWQGDAAVIAGVLRRRLGAWRSRWAARWQRRGVRAAAVALCLGLAVWLLGGSAPPPLVHPPVVIGHRGCIYEVENTLPAIETAAALGADYAEIDVQLSADGVPVVVHDGNLWRLAGQNVSVGDSTAAQLAAIPLPASGYATQDGAIPTLEALLAWVAADPARPGLLVELKPAGDGAAPLAAAVLALVEQYDLGGRLMFMSQDLYSVTTLKSAHPEWWVGYCAYSSAGELDEGIWRYDVDFLAVEESMLSNRLTRLARSQSLPLYVWSVYDSDKMLQYLQMGVTGLITDYPDFARAVTDAYRAKDTAAYRLTAPGLAA